MRLTLAVLVVFFSLLCSAQTPGPATAGVAASHQEPFPCFAKRTNPPHAFQGFLKWNPVNAARKKVGVTLGFSSDPKVALPCVGEPLEITVPNRQEVMLQTDYFAGAMPCPPPTITVAPANTDLPIGEILTMASKIGPFLVAPGTTGKQAYALAPLTNKVLTITATCETADKTAKFTQTAKITYQNPPRITVSGGLIGSPGVKSFGINTTQTGVGSNGVVTTQNSLAITGSPAAQVIPFSFVNLYLSGSRTLNLNAQLGLGVNPNLSSSKVEFFATPLAIGWHDFYFSPGFHIGQHEKLTGGFTVGELTSLSKPPIGWTYYTGFGFSLSYNLKPLVKASAAK